MLEWGRVPAMKGRRWATGKGRAAGHGTRRAVRVRVVTVGGDEMRGRLRDMGAGVVKGISGVGEGGRWWEVINPDGVTRGVVVRIGTRGLAGRIVAALCDCGVANRGCSRKECFCVRCYETRLGMVTQVEGVTVVAVPDGFEWGIVAALSYRGVRISTRSSDSTLGRLRVDTSS